MRLHLSTALLAALALSAAGQIDPEPANNRPRRDLAPGQLEHGSQGGEAHLVARKLSAAAQKRAAAAAKAAAKKAAAKKAAAAKKKKKVVDPKAVAALSRKSVSLKLKSQSLARKAASLKSKSASLSRASKAKASSASKKAKSLASAAKKASIEAKSIASKAASAAKAAKSIAAAKSSLSKAQAAASNSLAAGGVPAAVSASIAAAQKSLQAELASASSLASVHSVAQASLASVSAALASQQASVARATASLAAEVSSVTASFASIKSGIDSAASDLATSTSLFGVSASSLTAAQGALTSAQSALSAQGSAVTSLAGQLAGQAASLGSQAASLASKSSSLAAAATATGLSKTCQSGAFLWRENCLSACPTDTSYVSYMPSGQSWSYCCLGSDANTVCTGSAAEDITACSSGNVVTADGCVASSVCTSASLITSSDGLYCCADPSAADCDGPAMSDTLGCNAQSSLSSAGTCVLSSTCGTGSTVCCPPGAASCDAAGEATACLPGYGFTATGGCAQGGQTGCLTLSNGFCCYDQAAASACSSAAAGHSTSCATGSFLTPSVAGSSTGTCASTCTTYPNTSTQLYATSGSSTCVSSCAGAQAKSVLASAGWCCTDPTATACDGVGLDHSTACAGSLLITPRTWGAAEGTCGASCGQDYFLVEDSVLGNQCAGDCAGTALTDGLGWSVAPYFSSRDVQSLAECRALCLTVTGAVAYAGAYGESNANDFERCSCLVGGQSTISPANIDPASCSTVDPLGYNGGFVVLKRYQYYATGTLSPYNTNQCSAGLALAASGACVDPATSTGCYPDTVFNGVCCPLYSTACSDPVSPTSCVAGYQVSSDGWSCVQTACDSTQFGLALSAGGNTYCFSQCVYSGGMGSGWEKVTDGAGNAVYYSTVDECAQECYAQGAVIYGAYAADQANPSSQIACACWTAGVDNLSSYGASTDSGEGHCGLFEDSMGASAGGYLYPYVNYYYYSAGPSHA